MKTRPFGLYAFLALCTLVIFLSPGATAGAAVQAGHVPPSPSLPDQARVSAALKAAPVMFVENVGQFDAGARFQVRGGNGTVYLADDALWFTILEKPNQDASPRKSLGPPRGLNTPLANTPRKGVNLKLSFVGANAHPLVEPFNRLDTHVSFFLGNDPNKWHPDVPVWGGVRYKDFYPGIDLEITSENGQMVQRVVARGGANLNAVQLRVDGADKMELLPSPSGRGVGGEVLRLTTAVGEFTLPLIQVTGAGSANPPRPTI